jgi:Holliday junction resolvasome RuvABC ATP-dependent DNA helicase subunit
MELGTGAMAPLLSKLGELLLDEYSLDKKVKKGVKSLATELTMMHAALRKVGDIPRDQLDDQVGVWAGKVRELSYEMEDAVDAFMVRVEENNDDEAPTIKKRVKKFLKKSTRLFRKGKDLHQISDAIEEAQDLAKQLVELRQRYGLEMHDNSVGAAIDPRLLAMYKNVTELVGVNGTRDELVEMLIGGDEWKQKQLKVVSIIGFGGLGKTTLAKSVHEKIKVHFDCGAFVSVSQSPDMKRVFKDILYELDKNTYGEIHNTGRGEKQLLDELAEFLENKR